MNGAQGRDRTTDTAIFSRMLYQLSYLGIFGRPKGLCERAVYREVGGLCPPAFACGFGGASPNSRAASARQAGRVLLHQMIGESRLFGVFRVGLFAGDDVFAGEPAVQVDVAAAGGT